MSEPQQQICPLCDGPAFFRPRDVGNRKFFYCDHCTEFEISRVAEKRVLEGSADRRNHLSLQAQSAPEGTYLSLAKPDAGADDGASLIGRYLKRSD